MSDNFPYLREIPFHIITDIFNFEIIKTIELSLFSTRKCIVVKKFYIALITEYKKLSTSNFVNEIA